MRDGIRMACSVLCEYRLASMGNQALGILDAMASVTPAFARAIPPRVPSAPALEAEMRASRLRLIAIASFGLGTCGVLWGLGHAVIAYLEVETDRMRLFVTVLQCAVLSAGGWCGFYRCHRGQLRRATYCNVAALMLAATINLVLVRNAEGAAVVTYAAAVGLAALVIQGRAWLWWAAILVVSTAVGSLLHSYPVTPQIELPHALAVTSLLFAGTIGLAVPMGLFWQFSRDVTTSHERAWRLAREAAEAHRLANDRAVQLERRTDQLQAKNSELNAFLYVVSHDLRAPLINLEGFSRALQESLAELDAALTAAPPARWADLKRDIDESLDFVVRSVAKMDFFVQGLLELSRIDSRPDLAEHVDLAELVQAVLDSLQFTIGERGIAVRVDALPAIVGDPVRLNQVFGNLIDNAVKYMNRSGPATIHIGCVRRDDALHFFVRDNGVGIRPEDQSKIFRMFGRVGGHAVPGDGMGLTMVKKIVEKTGGKIWVESALGRGSTFWFTLPTTGTAEEWEDEGGSAARADQDSARGG